MTENANTAAEQASMDDLIKLIEQRAATYGLLSRLFRVEIDQELLDELHGMRFPRLHRATPTWTKATCAWRSTCPIPGRTA